MFFRFLELIFGYLLKFGMYNEIKYIKQLKLSGIVSAKTIWFVYNRVIYKKILKSKLLPFNNSRNSQWILFSFVANEDLSQQTFFDLQDVLKMSWRHVLKMSWRRLQRTNSSSSETYNFSSSKTSWMSWKTRNCHDLEKHFYN